jgi:RNA polymerase sigma-70 factor, ECF subfamily
MRQISSEASDAELTTFLKQGNQGVLSILYDRYGGLVYSLALKLLGQPDEADDITQDVFLSFWKQEKFDPTRAKLSTYLCLLTRSRSIDKLRSRTVEEKSIERLHRNSLSETDLPTPLDSVTSEEEQHLVRQSLLNLSEQQRQTIELSYYKGLSQSAIAQDLDLPLGTVKTHMRQGLIKLRQMLQSQIG